MKTFQTFRYDISSFKRAVQAGVFGDRKVELVGGIVREMTTQPPHVYVVRRLPGILVALFPPKDYTLHPEQPVAISRRWMPYPDLAVIRSPSDAYLDHLPRPEEIRLIVEVADTTYAFDRGEKLKRYARAGIPEYWIVNIPDRFVEVFEGPEGDAYTTSSIHHEGEGVRGIPVEDMLQPT